MKPSIIKFHEKIMVPRLTSAENKIRFLLSQMKERSEQNLHYGDIL